MATNQYLPFGTAGGANVLSPTDYNSLAARLTGFTAGTAASVQLNTVWRQSSVMSAMVGEFVLDYGGFDALDDGNVDNLETSFVRTLQKQPWRFAVAGGTANALTATLSPAPAALSTGMAVALRISTDNTGAATLNVNSLGAVPIQTMTGAAIQRSDLPSGTIVQLIYSGTAWLFGGLAKSEVPQVPTADVTLYVRTDGNDNNNGSANNAANAFLTIAGAIKFGISRFTFGGFNLIIQLGNSGTYASPGNLPVIAGSLQIIGDVANQANYIIAGAPPAGSQGYVCSTGGIVTLAGLTINNSSTNISSAIATRGGNLILNNVTLASTVSTFAHVAASSGGVTVGLGCVITGNAAQCLLGQASGTVTVSANISVPSALNMSSAWGVTNTNGSIIWSAAGLTFTGTGGSGGASTGQRYNASLNGVINTSGGGALAFPGNTAGTTATGGQYA